MSRSSGVYQQPTTMWDSRYDDPFLEDGAPVFPDENVIYFCHNCNTEVGAYLREDYQPVCDTCFGEFLELRESNNASSSTTTTTTTRRPSIRQSTTTSRNNNTSNYLSVPPRQDNQRDRDEQRQRNNTDFQETQPGISFRLYNNNNVTGSNSSNNNNSNNTGYYSGSNSNDEWWRSLSTPTTSTSTPSPSLTIPDTTTRRSNNRRKKWWQKLSLRRNSSSSAQPTANDGRGDTRVVNGRLNQFASSLIRLKRPGNASSASFTSFHTTNSQNIAGGSSSAIETPLPSSWQDDEEESCAICSEDLYSPTMPAVKLSCQHIFHRTCVSHWLERDTTCPYCRRITYMRDAEPVTRPPKH
ncbi:hypothetical protein BDA99DRAFT_497563 [Phascolomyces articulosus]|uniref:RING-type domain-containing protein n=1 Tax=Phascolomyces articulosus TaxID=60185 RepID=A0AAD5PHN4_9FUNG|nr:hypothetical protein BDA99DRAFT_497563 [Phascolomyces articulosus]